MKKVPVVPDGSLSLGIPRRQPGNKSRKSYVVWEEEGIVPTLVLEVASWTPGGEYDDQLAIYEKLGVLYYIIYNPESWQRDRREPFEVYKLIDGEYRRQIGEPYWMPEIGLAIGRSRGIVGGIDREILSWFDPNRDRYLSAEEQAQQAQLEAQPERQTRLAAVPQLHQMGLTAEQISTALGRSLDAVNERLNGDSDRAGNRQ